MIMNLICAYLKFFGAQHLVIVSELFRFSPFTLLIVAISIGAQEAIEEIEVVGREVNLVGSALSASEGRVSFREINQRPILRPGDVLENVPGLVATQHSGSGKANQFFLRGFNLDHGTDFSTIVDGMPVNMRSHGHGQGYTDLNFLIPEMVEEITYRKGSYYSDVGDFSGAGSAKIKTGGDFVDNSVNFGVGEFGYGRVLVTRNTSSLGGNLVFGLEHQIYQGPWDSVSEDVSKTNLHLKQTWQRESGDYALSLMAYDNTWNSADQIPDRAVQSGLISKFGSIDPTVGGSSSRYSLSLSRESELRGGKLSVSAYVIDYEMNLFGNFSYFTSPQGDQVKQIDDRRIFGGNFVWLHEGILAGRHTENSFGGDLRIDDIPEVGVVSTRNRNLQDVLRLDKVREGSVGIYWQNATSWTEKFKTILGLRYDRFSFDVLALAAKDPSTLQENSGINRDGIATASLSFIYTASEMQEFYLSIGNGFHSNDARGTVISRDHLTGESAQTADTLVPTGGSEVGWRIYLTDRLNATLAIWQLSIDSELIFVGDSGSTEDTGVGSERHGFELTSYFQLNDTIGLDFEYAYTDSRFTELVDDSRDIPGALDQVISAGINFQPSDRFFAHLRVRHFSDFPLGGGIRADGSTMTNLRVGYELSDSLQLSLDLLNIFDSDDHDVEYFYESQLLGEPEAVADNHYHVFEPRAARLYLQYQF